MFGRTTGVGLTASTWPGPNAPEARSAYERARLAGLSAARSLVLGCIASFRDGWAFRRTLAEHTGLSVRTVQRAITQAKWCGLLGVARAKKTEVPTGLDRPLPCGWSHRWTIGWGMAVEAAREAVARTRLARIVKAAVQAKHPPSRAEKRQWTASEIDDALNPPASPMQGPRAPARPPRQWTASEIDAELARLAKVKSKPD